MRQIHQKNSAIAALALQGGIAQIAQAVLAARIDRLPPTRTIWSIVVLLGFGMFFELYDLLFSAYVAPSLVKSGLLTATTAGLFGTTGVASFIAALFTGLFIGTILCGFLADRFGRRAIFTWSLLWYSAANIMVALQTDAFGLNVWRIASAGSRPPWTATAAFRVVAIIPRSVAA